MNFAHIHLIINHMPLMTVPIVAIFLAYSIVCHNESLKRFSLIMLIATAALVVPVYLTGEPAEKVIEHLPGISERLIEAHEEAAEVALILTLLVGGMALAVLVFPKIRLLSEIGPRVILVACVVTVGSLGYTANLGGKIHHPEASESTFKAPAAEVEHGVEPGGDKDND